MVCRERPSVEIHFANRKVQKLCIDKKAAQQRLGSIGAKRLAMRLRTLEAAESLQDVADEHKRFHALSRERKGQFALDIYQGYRLVIKPIFNLENSHLESEGPSPAVLTKITVVHIEEITEYQ